MTTELKLRVGGKYRTADGTVVGPLRASGYPERPFKARTPHYDFDLNWMADGRHCEQCSLSLDLISEIIEPEKGTPMAEEIDGFYVILRDDDSRLVRHDDASGAAREADRLARLCPGHRFYVMGAIEARRAQETPVTCEPCRAGVPF